MTYYIWMDNLTHKTEKIRRRFGITWITSSARSLHLCAFGWRCSPSGVPHGLSLLGTGLVSLISLSLQLSVIVTQSTDSSEWQLSHTYILERLRRLILSTIFFLFLLLERWGLINYYNLPTWHKGKKTITSIIWEIRKTYMYFLSIKNYLLNSHLYTIRKWPFLMGQKDFYLCILCV